MAKIIAKAKVQIEAGKATPAPPVGPALAPHGINISEFCKQFNDKTKGMEGNMVPADITIYEDRSFSFVLKQPLVSHMIKKAIGIEKGSGFQKKTKVGKITKAQIRKIAEVKIVDFNTKDIEAAMRTVEGTAKAMGVEVVD